MAFVQQSSARLLCASNRASMTYVSFVYDETIEYGFHGFIEKNRSFASAIGTVSIKSQSIENWDIFHCQSEGKFSKTEQNQETKHRESLEKVVAQARRKKTEVKTAMASWLSGKIEGDENRPSPVQQKSKIPVRRVTRLNNDSGKSSSSKDEADQNQRMLRDSVDKLQNKRPSRIPIVVGQTNSKTGKDKLQKNVIAATFKRPLGRDSGIVITFFSLNMI